MRDVIAQLPAGSVYYMATDALLVSLAGYVRMKELGLIHPTELGKFKVKGIHQRGQIWGCNYYEMDGEVTAAGWAEGPPCDMADGSLCDVWERFPGIVARGPTDRVGVSRLPLGPYRPDRKGTVDATGKWHPYYLDDDPRYSDRPKPGGYTKLDFDRMRLTDWQ